MAWPEVQIQRSRRGVTVAIIRTPGRTGSQYWVPFRDQDAAATYALGETEVIAYGSRGRLAVLDLATERTVRECETEHRHGKTSISADRRLLCILAQNQVTCWDTSALSRLARFDGAEIKGDVCRVLSSKDPDFFPRLWRGEAEFFQSIREILMLRDDRVCVARDEPNAALFLVDPKTWQVERRPVTGRLHEALKTLDAPEDNSIQWPSDPGIERHLRTSFGGRIALSGLTEGAIATALERTAAQFERSVADYIVADTLRLAYPYKKRAVDEAELSGLIVDRQLKGTVPALRRLILAYLAGLRERAAAASPGGTVTTGWQRFAIRCVR